MRYFLILLLLPVFSFSQQLELHPNFRNAKVDTNKFDWYVSGMYQYGTDSTYLFKIKCSVERDNNILYYMYIQRIETRNFYMQYLYDTEIDADILSIAYYYNYKKIIRVGVDLTKNIGINSVQPGIFLGVKYKFITAEVVLWNKLERLQYEIKPTWKLTQKSSIGLMLNGYACNDNFKWNSGAVILIKM